MLKSHEKFHSVNGKRQVLVIDEEGNERQQLSTMLETNYEVLYGEDAKKALDLLHQNSDTLSLVVLDLLTTQMDGLEFLRDLRSGLDGEDVRHIPVIVLAADQQTEAESLHIGANDYIDLPHLTREVLDARVRRAIELAEDRQTILSTERDSLTGLYNREFFYHYAELYDQYHKDKEMDAIVVDVHHFRMINERHGKEYGDRVLCRIGEQLKEMVGESDGIICRRAADTFLVYCPHGQDYTELLNHVMDGLAREDVAKNTRVRLRMGVYEKVDRSIDMERRFDRAKMASDSVRNNYNVSIGFYDSRLHDAELYAEQLEQDFHEAIANHQFQVYYQPKFNIRADEPTLSSAEALVRWQHPTLGLINPGTFIPLFEENGMIGDLDRYVWRKAAEQIRDWKERFGMTIPVSVNVSRVDMFDVNLVETFHTILEEHEVGVNELLLEITESAYSEDADTIISRVGALRNSGFRIEMDDFGTGYSSLGLISDMPIDALKLDMVFVRNAFNERRDVRMLELIMGIADNLGVPVIAEGVETREQMVALKTMGCELVQGFYFSRPVPAGEFEAFILEHMQKEDRGQQAFMPHMTRPRMEAASFSNISRAMENDFERLFYADTQTGHYLEFGMHAKRETMQYQASGENFYADLRDYVHHVVYEPDQEMLLKACRKEHLLLRLQDQSVFSMGFRRLTGGGTEVWELQAVHAQGKDGTHIVLGIRKAEDDRIPGEEHEAIRSFLLEDPERLTMEHPETEVHTTEIYQEMMRSLAADYFSIYRVNLKTEEYEVYSSDLAVREMELERGGSRFFEQFRERVLRGIHPGDRDRFDRNFTKERVEKELVRYGIFRMTYRILIDDDVHYISIKAMQMLTQEGMHGNQVVIGLSNNDGQKRREQEWNRMQEKTRG